METRLFAGAFALGWLVWICSLLATRRGSAKHGDILRLLIPSSWRGAAVMVPLIGFAATLPTRAPFAGGQGLGKGLLLGMVGALLSAWTMTRVIEMDALNSGRGKQNASAFIAPFGLAVVCACIPLLWMRGIVADALLGTAIGWLTTSLLLLAGLNARGAAGRALGLGVTAAAGWAATVCGAGVVGEYGGNVRFGAGLLPIPYSAVLMPLAAAIPFLLILCALYQRESAARSTDFSPAKAAAKAVEAGIVRWAAGGAVLLFVGAQFAHKLDAHPNMFRLFGMGLLASGLSWWLLTYQAARGNNSLNGRSLALPVLLFMTAGMVAFEMLAGVGLTIMLLAAWLMAGVALIGTVEEGGTAIYAAEKRVFTSPYVAEHLLRLLCFGALLLLYRLFQVRFESDLHGVLLPDYYALLAFIVGAVTPAALASYLHAGVWHRSKSREDVYETTRPALLKLFAVGALTLLIPAALLILFGTKCLLCLFFGLALASVLGDVTRMGETEEQSERSAFRPLWGELVTSLLALAMGLALAQWTGHVLPYGLMARAEKIHLLTMGVGAAVALLLVSEIAAYLNRLNSPPLSRPYEGASFGNPANIPFAADNEPVQKGGRQ